MAAAAARPFCCLPHQGRRCAVPVSFSHLPPLPCPRRRFSGSPPSPADLVPTSFSPVSPSSASRQPRPDLCLPIVAILILNQAAAAHPSPEINLLPSPLQSANSTADRTARLRCTSSGGNWAH